jgi:hypothetical protein
VRLVIVRAIIVIVPLITLLLLITLPILVPVFNPAACIYAEVDVAQAQLSLPCPRPCSFGGVMLLAESPWGRRC